MKCIQEVFFHSFKVKPEFALLMIKVTEFGHRVIRG